MDSGTLMDIHRIAIGYAINDESSLSDTIRDEGTLDYIASRAEDNDDPTERAAWLLWSVSTMHPFMEGNKRTAVLACECALGSRGLDVDNREDALNALIRIIASGSDIEDVRRFLEKNTAPLDPSQPLDDIGLRAERISTLLLELSR